VSIIKNGLDLPVINPVSKSSCKENIAISLDHLAYTYIGRIHPKKGLHIFLAAVLAILDSPQKNLLKPFSLLIAGDFSSVSYQAQIFHIVKLIDARIPISFLGHVEGRMKTDLLLATDVFFLPSLSEGMPNAILEALSYGIPVFATTTCNLPEIAQYSMGILAEPSVESISTSLLRLQSLAPADLLNMSANARHFVSAELSPSRTDTSYDSLISAILSVPLPF
jgi:poly(glycerol-phosphate) alpha-glucosyltransferase